MRRSWSSIKPRFSSTTRTSCRPSANAFAPEKFSHSGAVAELHPPPITRTVRQSTRRKKRHMRRAKKLWKNCPHSHSKSEWWISVRLSTRKSMGQKFYPLFCCWRCQRGSFSHGKKVRMRVFQQSVRFLAGARLPARCAASHLRCNIRFRFGPVFRRDAR